VLGTSLSARAAKGLQDGAGIESTTLAGLLSSLDTGAEVLGAGDVVVVDEAGMVGTRQLARLLEVASRARAKVVLVGDPRQLPEIEAGGVFGALARRLGALELCENRRQRELWEREALDELRSGDPLRGLAAFAAAGRVVTAPGMAETRHALVARWQESRARGEDALMLASTRRKVDALNVAARRALKEQGLLGEDVGTFGDLAFAVGDAVVATRNDRRLGVRNGTRGVVEHLDRAGVVVSTREGRLSLPAPYASAHLAHGYALTIHKAQGATVDRAFVLVTDALTREAGYVAMSRARKGTELFVPSAGVDDDLGCADGPAEADDPLVRVGQRLSVSKAKRLALEEYQPQLFDVRGDEEGRFGEVPQATARSAREPGSAVAGEPGSVPAYQVEAIGCPPAFADERREYERVARVLAEYRDRYEVVGRDPLGPVPMEALRRTRYEEVRRELRRYERRLGRARELPGPDLGLGR
jgi:ATP-dependent exoDNAse (exonuclease V) alpha subunit